MCYIKKTISVKILVICVINSSRHRKYFVWGYIHELFVSKPRTASSLLFFFAKLQHAKPKHASGEAACRVSWFAIALDEIRTGRILREKADCKQSTKPERARYERVRTLDTNNS